nr:MAG TPA: hypothetical protein [Caudoviricetes sp.]
MELLTTLTTSNLFISLITTVLGAIFSIHLYKNKLHNSYLKEAYETVIFPSFKQLEPYLYSSEITDELNMTTKEICDLLSTNRMIISNKLWHIVYLCNADFHKKDKISKKHFTSLCAILSIEYDKSCKQLGLNSRSLSYKLLRKQLHPDKATLYNYFLETFATTIYLLCLGFIMFFFINLFHTLIELLNI